MKKLTAFVLALVCVMGLIGCSKQTPERIKTIESNLKTYYELHDGTWECDGHIYISTSWKSVAECPMQQLTQLLFI